MARDRAPEIVLSDVNMPGMDGIEFCRAIRADADLRGIYVILATGVDTPQQRTEGIAAGADDYVAKPIRADELQARLRLATRFRVLQREVADLQRRAADADRIRLDAETFQGRVKDLRGELGIALGTILDGVRRTAENARSGDLKFAAASAEKVVAEVEALRTRVAPPPGA
jgi:DNA-binding response OmpR family regulator